MGGRPGRPGGAVCRPATTTRAPASGVEGLTVKRSEDFAGALEHAMAANKPFLIDAHVAADVKPPSTGAWQLPPLPYAEPAFGERYIAE